MKAFKSFSVENLGSGQSRQAHLLENGLVCKVEYSEGWAYLGAPQEKVFNFLVEKYQDLEMVQKFTRLLSEGYKVSPSGIGTLTEYLVSKYIEEDKEINWRFALCLDISIKKNKKKNILKIKGLYEDAYKKSKRLSEEYIECIECELEDEGDFFLDSNRYIADLHSDNYINGIIIDYACIREI